MEKPKVANLSTGMAQEWLKVGGWTVKLWTTTRPGGPGQETITHMLRTRLGMTATRAMPTTAVLRDLLAERRRIVKGTARQGDWPERAHQGLLAHDAACKELFGHVVRRTVNND